MANSFDMQRYFKEGWELFSLNVANFVVATIIFAVAQVAANFIPFAAMLISGPLMGGLYMVVIDAEQGVPFEVMRMFDGFRQKLVPLVLAGILTTIFVISGFILLILPGFLIMGWYLFTYIFIIKEDMDFWEAMEASRKIGFENHINILMLAIAIGIVNLVGMMALGIGMLVTIPFTISVVLKAFEDMRGADTQGSISSGGSAPPPPPPVG